MRGLRTAPNDYTDEFVYHQEIKIKIGVVTVWLTAVKHEHHILLAEEYRKRENKQKRWFDHTTNVGKEIVWMSKAYLQSTVDAALEKLKNPGTLFRLAAADKKEGSLRTLLQFGPKVLYFRPDNPDRVWDWFKVSQMFKQDKYIRLFVNFWLDTAQRCWYVCDTRSTLHGKCESDKHDMDFRVTQHDLKPPAPASLYKTDKKSRSAMRNHSSIQDGRGPTAVLLNWETLNAKLTRLLTVHLTLSKLKVPDAGFLIQPLEDIVDAAKGIPKDSDEGKDKELARNQIKIKIGRVIVRLTACDREFHILLATEFIKRKRKEPSFFETKGKSLTWMSKAYLMSSLDAALEKLKNPSTLFKLAAAGIKAGLTGTMICIGPKSLYFRAANPNQVWDWGKVSALFDQEKYVELFVNFWLDPVYMWWYVCDARGVFHGKCGDDKQDVQPRITGHDPEPPVSASLYKESVLLSNREV
jgi:hypothetical protein